MALEIVPTSFRKNLTDEEKAHLKKQKGKLNPCRTENFWLNATTLVLYLSELKEQSDKMFFDKKMKEHMDKHEQKYSKLAIFFVESCVAKSFKTTQNRFIS